MEIYAKGKNIQTYPFSTLFKQGEKFADTITFYIDRYYNNIDLYTCSFMLRGINANNGEAEQILLPEICNQYIKLNWNVSDYFTIVSGKLELELRAYKSVSEASGVIVKYKMPPIYVCPSPLGENIPTPDVEEQILNEISSAVSEGLTDIQQLIDSFDISAVEERLDEMDSEISIFMARPEVIPITQSEYDAIVKKENALYVIVEQ